MTIQSKRLQILRNATSLLISGGLVGWLVSRIGPAQVRTLLADADRGLLAVAVLPVILLPLFATWRWSGILQAEGSASIPFLYMLRANLMALVLNSVLPSKGGDLVKALYLRDRTGLSTGIYTVLLERLVDLHVLALLAIGGAAATQHPWGIYSGFGLLILVSGLLALLILLAGRSTPFPTAVHQHARGFIDLAQKWIGQPRSVGRTLFGSVGVWLSGGGILFLLSHAFHTPLSVLIVFVIYPLAVLGGLVPVTVSGIGTRDTVLTALLTPYTGVESATLIALGYTVYAYWLLSVICLPIVAYELRETWRNRPVD